MWLWMWIESQCWNMLKFWFLFSSSGVSTVDPAPWWNVRATPAVAVKPKLPRFVWDHGWIASVTLQSLELILKDWFNFRFGTSIIIELNQKNINWSLGPLTQWRVSIRCPGSWVNLMILPSFSLCKLGWQRNSQSSHCLDKLRCQQIDFYYYYFDCSIAW